MHQMLEGEAYAEQTAAFLLGWRVKPETIEEYKGALSVCDSYIKHMPVDNSIELGYPYDGKLNNPYLFPLVAKILANSDLHIVMNGGELQPAKGGLTVKRSSINVNFPITFIFLSASSFLKRWRH